MLSVAGQIGAWLWRINRPAYPGTSLSLIFHHSRPSSPFCLCSFLLPHIQHTHHTLITIHIHLHTLLILILTPHSISKLDLINTFVKLWSVRAHLPLFVAAWEPVATKWGLVKSKVGARHLCFFFYLLVRWWHCCAVGDAEVGTHVLLWGFVVTHRVCEAVLLNLWVLLSA